VRVEKADRALRIDGEDGFVEIRPGVFGRKGSIQTFSFVPHPATGKIILSSSQLPSAYERPSLVDNPRVVTRTLFLLWLLGLSGLLLALIPGTHVAPIARIAAAAYAVVLAAGIGLMFGLHAFGDPYFSGVSWPLDVVRACAFLTIPASLGLVGCAIRMRETPPTLLARTARVHFGLVSVSSVLMVVALLGEGLLTFAPIT
jgi:hypothetical protein